MKQLKELQEKQDLLKRIPFFADMSNYYLKKLAEDAGEMNYKKT